MSKSILGNNLTEMHRFWVSGLQATKRSVCQRIHQAKLSIQGSGALGLNKHMFEGLELKIAKREVCSLLELKQLYDGHVASLLLIQ